jgi:hypothetical protein
MTEIFAAMSYVAVFFLMQGGMMTEIFADTSSATANAAATREI